MDIFNGFLSVIMHVLIAVFLLIYLPVSWIWRLVVFVFVKPFYKEDVGGKVILITGASSGIGEELAYQYATKGASLVLVARREQALKEVAMAAFGKGSPDVLVIKADISKQSECKRVIEEAIAHFTKLNHLVVNAGLLSSSLFEEITNIAAFNQIMVQIGFFPVGCTDKFAEIVVESACRGDEYVTWPSWYKPLHALTFFAPEIINWYSRLFYLTKSGADSSKTLSRKILEATGAKKFLYPSSIRSSTIKMDRTE